MTTFFFLPRFSLVAEATDNEWVKYSDWSKPAKGARNLRRQALVFFYYYFFIELAYLRTLMYKMVQPHGRKTYVQYFLFIYFKLKCGASAADFFLSQETWTQSPEWVASFPLLRLNVM